MSGDVAVARLLGRVAALLAEDLEGDLDVLTAFDCAASHPSLRGPGLAAVASTLQAYLIASGADVLLPSEPDAAILTAAPALGSDRTIMAIRSAGRSLLAGGRTLPVSAPRDTPAQGLDAPLLRLVR